MMMSIRDKELQEKVEAMTYVAQYNFTSTLLASLELVEHYIMVSELNENLSHDNK